VIMVTAINFFYCGIKRESGVHPELSP